MPTTISAPRLDDLLTPDALAAQLHTTTRNLREWRTNGRGPRFVRIGRFPLYRPEAVEAWLRDQEYASTADELR
ncbi:helix-turn-helix domain-containing protein [Curtobacterium flaccumfaciens]|uniref:helix-turn-helix transcriptional regulator n=1 Tax=Curtobacterium TaxID=2034 RepID=UPI000F48DBA0|nr:MULTISPECIES: helix-turn-helix domain-containing protein [Curtobacterium]ROR36408.1 AlpA family transcriptional regulator [Curtobacterium sp. JUb34]UXN20916.1 helix-turn-helix domain-containing protein [Curtobacterium flaccumfaciens pv. flaccumfaciens]